MYEFFSFQKQQYQLGIKKENLILRIKNKTYGKRFALISISSSIVDEPEMYKMWKSLVNYKYTRQQCFMCITVLAIDMVDMS